MLGENVRMKPENQRHNWRAGLAFALVFVLGACLPAPGAPQPAPTLTTAPSQLTPTHTAVSLPAGTASVSTPLAATMESRDGSPSQAATPTKDNPLSDPGKATWALIVSGLDRPVGLTHAEDGSGRVFVIEKRGDIRLIKGASLGSTPFLDIQDRVGSQGSEQGLLGLVFDPQYTQNGFFYVNYTDLSGDTNISRFSVTKQNPDLADPGSEIVLLHVNQPFPNHNGGGLAFGPDGFLYIGLGDGGSEGDPLRTGQSLDTLLGKMLRIDVSKGEAYSIPPDNPFVNGGGKPEIWAYGLRNPWRFSFDRQTGDLYIGDVGQNTWEEVDFLPKGSPGGANFGWSYREGMHPYQDTPPQGITLVEPVAEYSHDEGGCSTTGGYVYRGQALPAWQGIYLFGDYCSGKVWGLQREANGQWMRSLLFQTNAHITSFGEDEVGELYLTDDLGGVYRLQPQ